MELARVQSHLRPQRRVLLRRLRCACTAVGVVLQMEAVGGGDHRHLRQIGREVGQAVDDLARVRNDSVRAAVARVDCAHRRHLRA
eukprot:6067135-Prymnesium_polylepis.1